MACELPVRTIKSHQLAHLLLSSWCTHTQSHTHMRVRRPGSCYFPPQKYADYVRRQQQQLESSRVRCMWGARGLRSLARTPKAHWPVRLHRRIACMCWVCGVRALDLCVWWRWFR